MNSNRDLSSKPSFQVDAGYLSPEITTQLIHRCRQEGTTVHAAICTAWLFAITQHPHNSEQTLHCFSPVNLRPYLMSQLEQECGLFISPVRTSHTIASQTQFWQIARSLKSSLTTQIEENLLLKQVQCHEALIATKPSPDFIHNLFNQHCTSDVMVTNLGRLAIPQHYGNLFLNAIYGPLVLSGFEQERVCGVATLGDRLFYTVIHQSSEAESRLVQQMTQLLETASALPAPNPMELAMKEAITK